MVSQEARTRRAAEQAGRYTFRIVDIRTTAGPFQAVYVTSPQGTVYTVSYGGHHPRCNCPDYLRRCAGTTARCKHIEMAQSWLARARRIAHARQMLARDFPED